MCVGPFGISATLEQIEFVFLCLKSSTIRVTISLNITVDFMPKPDYGATISYLYFWYLSKIGVTQKHWTQSLQYHTSVSKVIKQNRVYKITNPLSYQRVSLTLICLVQVETVNLFIVTSFISKFSVVSYILLIFFL